MKLDPKVKKYVVLGVKCLVFLAVLAGVAHTINKSLDEFAANEFSLAKVRWEWMAVSGVLYLLGMAPACWFWHRTLTSMGQKPKLWESARAFYISQLGKYVPGKAMVVVIRSAMVKSKRVNATVAAVSVFVETLTMMAVGAFVACAIMAVLYRDQIALVIVSVLLMICAGLPSLPPIFTRVVRLLQVKRLNPEIDKSLDGVNYRLMAEGWFIDGFGWCFLGLSLWAALMGMTKAIPGLEDQLWSVSSLPLLSAAMALGCVAGFVSLLPGGVLVREWVVIGLVAPVFGEVAAIVSAVLVRLASLLAEVGFSCILWFVPGPKDLAEESPNTEAISNAETNTADTAAA